MKATGKFYKEAGPHPCRREESTALEARMLRFIRMRVRSYVGIHREFHGDTRTRRVHALNYLVAYGYIQEATKEEWDAAESFADLTSKESQNL